MKPLLTRWLSVMLALCLLLSLAPAALMEGETEAQAVFVEETAPTVDGDEQAESKDIAETDTEEYIVATQMEQTPEELDDLDLPSEDVRDVDDSVVYVAPHGEEEDEENIFDSDAVPEDPMVDSNTTSDEQDNDTGNATDKQDITSDEVPEETATSEENTDAMIVSSMDNDTKTTPKKEDETESVNRTSSNAENDNDGSTNEQKEAESDSGVDSSDDNAVNSSVNGDFIGDEYYLDEIYMYEAQSEENGLILDSEAYGSSESACSSLYESNTDLPSFSAEASASSRILIYHQGGSEQWDWQSKVITTNYWSETYKKTFQKITMGSHNQGINTGWGWGCGIYALAHIVQWTSGNKMNNTTGGSLLDEFINDGIAHNGFPWDGYAYGNVLNKYGVQEVSVPNGIYELNKFFYNKGAIRIMATDGSGHYSAVVGIARGSNGDTWVHVVDSSCYSTIKRTNSKVAYNLYNGNAQSFGYVGGEYWIPYSDYLGIPIKTAYRCTSNGGNTYSNTSNSNTSSINKTYRIKSTTTLGLNIRPSATTASTSLGLLYPGVTIACTKRTNYQSDGYYWLYGTTSTGITGWICENMGWIEEVQNTSTSSGTATTNTTTTNKTATRTVTRSATYTAKVGLLCQLLFKNGETAKSYKSTNTKILSVSSTGLVTIKAVGKAKIKIKTNKKKYTLTIKAYDPTIPTKVSLSIPKTTIAAGGSITLTPVIPSGTNTTYTWKTSNKKVATVTNGTVKFNKKGKVTITCIANRGKKKAKVTFRVKK